jgi:hypothetical protein
MSVSKYDKTYGADGSERSFDGDPGPRAGSQRGAEIGRERWEDDGGPADDGAAAVEASKPRWSVLSAVDLAAAVRRQGRADDPERVATESARALRRAAAARTLSADRDAAEARGRRDRYRNAWENT